MRISVAIALAVVALSGCGGDEDLSAGAPSPSGGLTVQEAIDSELDGPLLVRGYLIERSGELRLCEAILESYPPQCGKPSLKVEGGELAPSEEPASLLGEVEGDVLRVSEKSR